MLKKAVKTVAAPIMASVIACSLGGCYFFPAEEPVLDPPTLNVDEVVYSTYTVARKDISSVVIQSGYVVSGDETDCFFSKYTGQIKNVYVTPGDFVEEGQLIAEMNNGTISHQLEIQRLKVELAQLNYNNSGSAADRLQLEIEQTTLEAYQDQYDGGMLYAPKAGQVSFVKTLNPGDYIDPYDVIVRIIDPEKLCIKADIGDSKEYVIGDEVSVEINGEYYSGVVVRTPKEEIEEMDTERDALYVEFTGKNPDFGYLGSIGNVIKVKAESKNALVIPKYVIKSDGDRNFVQILKGEEKFEVDVTVGISNAVETEILSGLSEGDKVIAR